MEDYQKNGKQKVVSFYGKTKQEVRDKKKAYDAGSEQGLDLKAKYTFASCVRRSIPTLIFAVHGGRSLCLCGTGCEADQGCG